MTHCNLSHPDKHALVHEPWPEGRLNGSQIVALKEGLKVSSPLHCKTCFAGWYKGETEKDGAMVG